MSSEAATGRKSRRWLGLVVLLLALLGGAGVVAVRALHREPPPQPPTVDLSGAGPAVTAAIESALARVRQAPRDAEAWGFLGMVLYAHDYFVEAPECFRQAGRLDRREPRWPYYLGVVLAMADPPAALPELRRAVDLWGEGELQPRLRLADLLLAQGHVDEAEEQYQTALKQAPQDGRSHLGLARVALERNDRGTALKHLETCLSAPETARAARTLRAEIFHRQGRSQAAERERRLAGLMPEGGAASDPFLQEIEQLQVGWRGAFKQYDRLREQGRSKEALAVLQEAAREYPQVSLIWLLLGRRHLEEKAPEQAEQALRTALAKEPGSAEATFYLGVSLFAQKRTDEAAGLFRQTIERRPDSAEAHFNLGQCLKLQGKPVEAIRQLREALRFRPHFTQAHAELGELLGQQGHDSEAREHLGIAARLQAEDREARELLRKP